MCSSDLLMDHDGTFLMRTWHIGPSTLAMYCRKYRDTQPHPSVQQGKKLDATTLARTATVMRDRCDVLCVKEYPLFRATFFMLLDELKIP